MNIVYIRVRIWLKCFENRVTTSFIFTLATTISFTVFGINWPDLFFLTNFQHLEGFEQKEESVVLIRGPVTLFGHIFVLSLKKGKTSVSIRIISIFKHYMSFYFLNTKSIRSLENQARKLDGKHFTLGQNEELINARHLVWPALHNPSCAMISAHF